MKSFPIISLCGLLFGLTVSVRLPLRDSKIIQGDLCRQLDGRKYYLSPGTSAILSATDIAIDNPDIPKRFKIGQNTPVFRGLNRRIRRSKLKAYSGSLPNNLFSLNSPNFERNLLQNIRKLKISKAHSSVSSTQEHFTQNKEDGMVDEEGINHFNSKRELPVNKEQLQNPVNISNGSLKLKSEELDLSTSSLLSKQTNAETPNPEKSFEFQDNNKENEAIGTESSSSVFLQTVIVPDLANNSKLLEKDSVKLETAIVPDLTENPKLLEKDSVNSQLNSALNQKEKDQLLIFQSNIVSNFETEEPKELVTETTSTASTRTSPRSSFHVTAKTRVSERQARCGIELFTCPDCHLNFNIKRIKLTSCSHDQSCRCDYLQIREPPYLTVGGRDICSVEDINSPYSTQTKDARIDFFYSRNYEEAFFLKVTAEKNIYTINGDPGVNEGSIESPFFPELYPNNFGALYTFKSSTFKSKIKVTFLDFQISPWSFLEVEDTNKSRAAIFNGNIFRPPVLVSSGPEITVRFNSNGETARGFRLHYAFLKQDSVETVPPLTDCGGYVTNFGGVITMMNMTSTVSASSRNVSVTYDCIWIIQPLQDYAFKSHTSVRVVEFEKMGTDSVLEIHQGMTSKDYLLERLTVSDNELQISSKEYVVSVDTGFYIRLKASFKTESKLAIVYTSFSYHGNCYALTNFLCRNHRCIPKMLKCDGFDHCGDSSDEPPSCFREISGKKMPTPHNTIWWYENTPNYYFPQKTNFLGTINGSGILVLLSLLVLLIVIIGLLYMLFRQNTRDVRTRRNRDRRNQANFNEGVEIFDAAEDDPPLYEAPPDYEEVVKLILSGNNLKLVRRPCGRTAWVPDVPKESPTPTEFRRSSLMNGGEERPGVGHFLTLESGENPPKRTRHSSLGSDNEIVLWQTNSVAGSRKPSNCFRNANQESDDDPLLPNVQGHSRRPSLPVTPFISKLDLNSIEKTNAKASVASKDAAETTNANLGVADVVSKERKESLTFPTSNKIMTNVKKKSTKKKKRSIKCKSPDNPFSSTSPPPPYEISLPRKRSKNEKSLSKKDNVIKVSSSNFKRSSLKRDSTALRVRTARERFQKLSRGEPVKMNDIYELKGDKNYLLCHENVEDEEKESIEIVCKGILNEKKAELLKLSCQNCLCSDECTCGFLRDDKPSEREGKEGVKFGLAKSQIQFFKAIEDGRDNEENIFNLNDKPIEKSDKILKVEKVRKTFANKVTKSYSLSMISKLTSTVNKDDGENILSINYKRQRLVKNFSWPFICQTCHKHDSCVCHPHALVEKFDEFFSNFNNKNNIHYNKICSDVEIEIKDEEGTEVKMNKDKINSNVNSNELIPIPKSLINTDENKAIMKENVTSRLMNLNSPIKNENYDDIPDQNKSHNLYANNFGETDDFSSYSNEISPSNAGNTSIPFSSLNNIVKNSTSQKTRNNDGISTLKPTSRETFSGKDISPKPSSGAVPKKYRPNSLSKKGTKRGKSLAGNSYRNHSAEGAEPDSEKITK